MASYYEKNKEHGMKYLRELVPEPFKAFAQFDRKVFKPGALTKKEKEILAVAIAHATKCPYCIDVHTKKAKRAGASLEELVEAVFVVSAMEAGVAANSNEMRDNGFSQGYTDFSHSVLEAGHLSRAYKELIAAAAAFAIQCPGLADRHMKNSMELGITNEQLDEAISVASALKAGSAYAHLLQVLDSYME